MPPANNFTNTGNTMFNKKYAPAQFGDLVFQNDVARKKLADYVSGSRRGNLLLYGPYGTGKSTTARVIAQTSPEDKNARFSQDIDAVNCSRFKRDAAQKMTFEMIETSWQFSGQKYPYAVLDEFDLLSPGHEDTVRDLMDRNEDSAGFILTTNHLHRIDGAILSRCDVVELPQLAPNVLLAASQRILGSEGISISDRIVLQLASSSNGSWRALLRELEAVVEGARAKKGSVPLQHHAIPQQNRMQK